MITFIGPDIILSDLTEGPTLFAQSGMVSWNGRVKQDFYMQMMCV